MKIETAYLSECGGRDKNEDTVRIVSNTDELCVFVGDGLGGYNGGEMASTTAAQTIVSYWTIHGLLPEVNMKEAVEAADKEVKKLQKNVQGAMKTTLVTLVIEDYQARWMHVGDSRLYHFVNGVLKEQTMDHSVSQMAVLMGEISAKEIRFHEDRNKILRALGGENVRPDISPVLWAEAEEDHAFLLCTDGFWEYLYEEEMQGFLQRSRTPQEWLAKMKELHQARVPEHHDNFSAAAVFWMNR